MGELLGRIAFIPGSPDDVARSREDEDEDGPCKVTKPVSGAFNFGRRRDARRLLRMDLRTG
jgi:hypothetical protein